MFDMMLCEVIDETAACIVSFPEIDNFSRHIWKEEFRDMKKSFKRGRIIGFFAVSDKGEVHVYGDIEKMKSILRELGHNYLVEKYLS